MDFKYYKYYVIFKPHLQVYYLAITITYTAPQKYSCSLATLGKWMQNLIQCHSRSNVSIVQFSVFIRGDHTRLECWNAGLWMQLNRALYSFTQSKTRQTCCKLSILLACCNLWTSCRLNCYNLLRQLVTSL